MDWQLKLCKKGADLLVLELKPSRRAFTNHHTLHIKYNHMWGWVQRYKLEYGTKLNSLFPHTMATNTLTVVPLYFSSTTGCGANQLFCTGGLTSDQGSKHLGVLVGFGIWTHLPLPDSPPPPPPLNFVVVGRIRIKDEKLSLSLSEWRASDSWTGWAHALSSVPEACWTYVVTSTGTEHVLPKPKIWWQTKCGQAHFESVGMLHTEHTRHTVPGLLSSIGISKPTMCEACT